MALSNKPYKGTRDFFPPDMRIHNAIFSSLSKVVENYGYEQYNGPMLESFDLYAAKTGEEIVNAQLYHFEDRGKRRVAVRPEMTPTLARMVSQQVQELPKPIRWFSLPNLWRYERPQRGRLREHWQLNVDLLGGDTRLADSEILSLAFNLISEFKGQEHIQIHINHRGLVNFVFQDQLGLSAEQALQVSKAVDARPKIGEAAYEKWLSDQGVNSDQAIKLEAFFKSDFTSLCENYPCEAIDDLKAIFKNLECSEAHKVLIFDPMIMRGLDYYTGLVFEIFDTSPENNRAMFGGGRYDNLIGLFGKHQLSGVGFGMGDVTLRNFLETHKLMPAIQAPIDYFVALTNKDYWSYSQQICKVLRVKGHSVYEALSDVKLANQFKQAHKLNSKFVIIVGEDEVAQKQFQLKELATGEQKTYALSELEALD
ncbi:MAG: histidine--tRNA ligase [Bdellovibrionaceae bacterium]|jgi:histidyl-tRNA synthetase|nr:histidine--tRNA ligase [Pseudobdellovibrionaceae bacterium]